MTSKLVPLRPADTTRVVTRAVVIRAAVRAVAAAVLVGLLVWKRSTGLVAVGLAGYVAAVVVAVTLVERAAGVRAARRRSPRVRGAVEASLVCAALHAAAIANALLWLADPGPDLGAKLARVAAWLGPRSASEVALAAFVLACMAWLLAGPSGPAALIERGKVEGGTPRLDGPPLDSLPAWSYAFALAVGPVSALSLALQEKPVLECLGAGLLFGLVGGGVCVVAGGVATLLVSRVDAIATGLAPEAVP